MYSHETTFRVRYAETDRMGFLYYGIYAQYFEVGRVEILRSLGMSYKVMEEEGVMQPVLDLFVKYIQPAYYDDILKVRTTILELPSVRISFAYEVRNEAGKLITEAKTNCVFISSGTMRPCKAPDTLLELLRPHFK